MLEGVFNPRKSTHNQASRVDSRRAGARTGGRVGRGIVYCHACGARLLEADFETGRAITLLKRSYCSACAKALATAAPETPEHSAPRPLEMPRGTIRLPVATLREGGGDAKRFGLLAVIVLTLLALSVGVLIGIAVSRGH